MIDAIALAQSLYEHHDDVGAALRAQEGRRRPRVRRAQAEARSSMAWYERVDRYTDRSAVGLAVAMSSRHRPLSPWSYQLHLATEVMPFRKAKRWYNSARRFYRARRRGELLALPTSHVRPFTRGCVWLNPASRSVLSVAGARDRPSSPRLGSPCPRTGPLADRDEPTAGGSMIDRCPASARGTRLARPGQRLLPRPLGTAGRVPRSAPQ
jgi:hypothetical protein